MTTNETIKQQVKHQMRIIRQGAANLVGEEELEAKLENSILTGKPLTVKFGMDPSAPDLHIGHAVALRKLKQLQDMGHTIVIVIGDFTAKIGDPTGRAKGRKAMTEQEILKLASTITVARMLERDDFEKRFRNNVAIGLHEFFYPLMQAYDSVVLKADLELGGTDQTFNVLMGRSLQKDRIPRRASFC